MWDTFSCVYLEIIQGVSYVVFSGKSVIFWSKWFGLQQKWQTLKCHQVCIHHCKRKSSCKHRLKVLLLGIHQLRTFLSFFSLWPSHLLVTIAAEILVFLYVFVPPPPPYFCPCQAKLDVRQTDRCLFIKNWTTQSNDDRAAADKMPPRSAKTAEHRGVNK